MKIAIMGAGDYGTALGSVLAEKGYDIDYYDPKFEKENLGEVLKNAKYIVLAIPSSAVPHFLPHLPKNIPLINATKGILSIKTFADFEDCVVISGPGFADEIKDHKTIKLTATDKRIVDLFTTNYLTFDYTNDINGVLMCGSLKNVYAIKAGLLNLDVGTKEHNDYLDAVIYEMKLILVENGSKKETVDLACGSGDLRLTCYYPSRNYEFGRKFSHNPDYKPEKTVEGISTLKRIRRNEIIVPKNAMILRELLEESKVWD